MNFSGSVLFSTPKPSAIGGIFLWFALVLAAVLAPLNSFAQGAKSAEYVMGSGDSLRIAVYQSPDLSVESRINEAGSISYPLLGQIRLGGLTVTQGEKVIADGLKNGNFIKSPQVTITVMQVRGNQANALGQVGKPGRYPLDVAGIRLSDLLAMAGGITSGGADIVMLSGVRGNQPFRRSYDLSALAGGTAGDDPVIQNGDTIFVDRMPQIFVYGEVQRPGVLRLERNMTVLQALAASGGLSQRGTDKGLKVHRTQPSGKVEVLEPAMNDPMRDGDVLYIRQSLF